MTNFQIIEKDDSISWDTIHDILWAAHAKNRDNGISMLFPSLPGDIIKEKVSKGNGKIFVALDNGVPIGCAAYTIKENTHWFCRKTKYMYLCFSGILPDYMGKGVYTLLNMVREKEQTKLQIPLCVFDTHINNNRVISIRKKQGYINVGYKFCKDHTNVIMAKWINGCPFSHYKISVNRNILRIKALFKRLIYGKK